MKRILLFAVLLMVQLGFGQTSIWTNPITGTNPNTSNPYTTGQTVDPNITVSGIGRGSGINGNNANDRYDAIGWDSGSINTNDYFQFTITPNSGYKINLSNFVYVGTTAGGGTGPTNYVLRSSLDGFTANIGTGLTNASTVNLSGAAFQNLTSAVTFRLYAWGASSATRRYGIDDFTFNGTVVPLSLTPTTSVGTYQFCIDNTNTQNSSVALSGQFATVNIIKGYTYSFSVGNAFTAYDERLTLLDMSNNQLATPITSTGATGASINNWIATYSGQVKVVLSNENGPNGLSGGAITLTLNAIGNTQDDQTSFGTNTWRGHIYNWTGTAPPGGGSPSPATPPTTNPFSASQYAGYYDVGTETIPTNFNFNGDTGCFNVFSNGTQRATIYPEQFAVRYRMKSTRAAGCYIVNIQGDDGVRLYVDNVLVFDEWEEQSPTNYQSILVYLDGDTDFILDYYENGGQNVVSFSITPFVSSSNSITAPTPSTVCSGVTPGVINGSSYTYNGSTINPTIKYQWQTATSASGPWSNVTTGTSGTAEDYTPAAITTTGAVTRYYKRVVSATAAYASACTWDSNVISITTGANATPPAPTSLAGTNVSCTSFTANWSSVATATTYRLDVSTVSNFTSFVSGFQDLPVGLVTSFNVAGLAVGTTYYYRVRSFNGCSNQVSGNSTVQSIVTANPSINAALSATSICQGTTTTSLSYTATGTPTTYSIVWNASPTNSFVPVTDAPITTPISIAVPAGTAAGTYTGTITVKNANGCQSVGDTFSVIVNAVPTITTSGTITAVCFNASATTATTLAYTATTGSPNSYSIDWNTVANSAGLTDQANTTQAFNSGSGNINIIIPANVNPGTYSGTMTIGNGNCNATQNVTITVNPLPSTPTVGTITNVTCSSAGSVVLSGLQSGWVITQSGTASGSYTSSGTSYTVTGLAVGSYTFKVSNGTCTSSDTPIVPIADASSTTWNGSSWSNGAPDATKNAIVTAVVPTSPFGSNLTACSLTISTGVTATVPSGVTLTITNAVTTNGQLIFENNASLVQTTNATNSGAIEYRRISSPMKNFDFTYWSSPVTGQTAKLLSPNTLADKYFRFDGLANDWIFDDGTMAPGVGFIIRVPKPGSPAPDNWSGSTYAQPVAFKGVPNNGNYSFGVGANQYNLVGNPYPSAIRADDFINANSGIIYGALYFWTHNTAIAPSGSDYVYTADDYASYTLAGGTGTSKAPSTGASGTVPNGFIAAGQSFFVGNAGGGSFQFTNAMRVSGNNSQFFKQASTKKTATIEKNRVWLNLTNSGGAFKQLLVGYIEGATNDWDNLYDGPTFDGQEFVDFYSINQGQNLTIQGRALPFVDTDVVPLGYRSTIAGTFEISIDNRDGALTNQAIWLEDKKTNTLHELSKGKYTFTAINGVENDRFVLKYTNKTLGTDDNEVVDTSLIVSVKNKKITLTSSAESITQVQIFDLLGRKIYDKSKINAQEWSISTLPSSEQTLIVKTTLANGAISNKKIIY